MEGVSQVTISGLSLEILTYVIILGYKTLDSIQVFKQCKTFNKSIIIKVNLHKPPYPEAF